MKHIHVMASAIVANKNRNVEDYLPPIVVREVGAIKGEKFFQADILDKQGNVVASVKYDPELPNYKVYIETENQIVTKTKLS